MSLIPIKLLCNRRPKSSSGSGSSSGSSSSGTTTNSAALPDWFYFNTEENSVHCKYPLVGDSEVAAFGYGSSSGSGGGGGSIDPSVLADYVTKSELDAAGYLQSADMSNYVTKSELNAAGYVTYSYLDSLDYETAITQLNANMSGLQQQLQYHKSYLTAYNTRISALEDRVDTIETYNLNDLQAAIQTLSAYLPILSYMELCYDTSRVNNNAYIKFTCPIISTGEVGAYKSDYNY